MGVYIKGMTAQQARMWLHYQMPFTFIVTNDDITEVPEPHGDLIDNDELGEMLNSLYEFSDMDKITLDEVRKTLWKSRTVIEAEGEQ